jgi:glycosyltransferase involved in cell wall biosynthesis
MRVVLVVQAPAWPAESGIGRRVEALHQALSADHEVHVLACLPAGLPDRRPPRGGCTRLGRPAGGLRALPRLAAAAVTSRPLTSAYYTSGAVSDGVARVLREQQPAVVVAQGYASALLVEGAHPAARTVLDLADAEHERVRALGRSGGWRKAPYRWDGERIARWLRRRLPQLGATTVVSQPDLDSYRRLAPDARLLLCPNGSAVREVPRPDPGGSRLLFLGDLEYLPNTEGLRWFADAVLPELPGVELRVVGRGAAPDAPGIDHVGFVEDLDGEWDAACALVVPLLTGGGTRLKVVEALAAGVPVVSTPLGVAGLDLVAGEHYLAAETPAEMAAAITQLLADPALRRRLGAAGHRVAAERYSWDRCLAPLSAEVRRLGS